MNICINNTIQQYLEQLIDNFGCKRKDELYETYKNIRTEISSKGFLYSPKRRTHGRHVIKESFLTNPKSISAGLFYLHCLRTNHDITQKELKKFNGVTNNSILNTVNAIKNMEKNEISR